LKAIIEGTWRCKERKVKIQPYKPRPKKNGRFFILITSTTNNENNKEEKKAERS
jgi:hypothetical protein